MNANVGPNTATDIGITRSSRELTSTRVTTTIRAVTPDRTTRRASWTLAYRHICPYRPNRKLQSTWTSTMTGRNRQNECHHCGWTVPSRRTTRVPR
jgi:hypothetical protein